MNNTKQVNAKSKVITFFGLILLYIAVWTMQTAGVQLNLSKATAGVVSVLEDVKSSGEEILAEIGDSWLGIAER